MYLKRMFKYFLPLFILGFSLLVSSCDIKQSTLGAQHRIFVVADSLLWMDVKDAVTEVFEQDIIAPHPEKSYHITWIPLNDLNAFNDRMNLVFLGISGGETDVDVFLDKSLPQTFTSGVKEGNYFYSFSDDMYARDQIGLIMMAGSAAEFKDRFASHRKEIFDAFTEKYYARLEKTMFERDENKKVQDFLTEHYGWEMKLQLDYFIAQQDIDNKYVWLRRINPNRWLSVWELQADSALLTQENLINVRNKMTRTYYQGDVVTDDEMLFEDVDFNGQSAKKLTGLWMNDSLMVGGPFRLYAWYDQAREKMHFIDIVVMAPSKDKKPFLDQLEVIAHTFRVVE